MSAAPPLAPPELSVVVPVFDEVESLAPLHREIETALVEAGVPGFELIFVDDGSRDGSAEVLAALAEKDLRVRVISLDGNHGQSAALAAGFAAVRAEVTATLDADLQNDPADLPRLLDALAGADLVNGVRVDRRDPWSKRAASRVANAFRNRVTGESVTDVGCSLRVMRTRFLRGVKLHRGMHRFLPTLLALEGARVVELPVGHRPRCYGRSKYGNWDRLVGGIVDCLAVRWMKRRALVHRARETTPER